LQAGDARIIIKEILGSDVSFEGHFNKCFNNLKETQRAELIDWIKLCKLMKANPIQSKFDRALIGFVKKIGSNLRAILTKKKDGYFIILFLDKHKYYEVEMNNLGF
jgi:hypothetical protein